MGHSFCHFHLLGRDLYWWCLVGALHHHPENR
ncbi:Uncharacterised protein [Vibrio cholerae]|nr:Uncharacterised protein [Vibrio cholerae]CSI53827.1 Uncharacterised protein [Vibrio cholerae]